MCRMVATVVISVWSGLCTVAAQETPREQPHYPPGFERPGRFLSKVPVGGPPSGSPSQPSPTSGPARSR